MTANDEFDILDILDTAMVPLAYSTVDRVRLLAEERERLQAELDNLRKRSDYDRLLAMLDEDRSDILLLLADACLDQAEALSGEGKREEAEKKEGEARGWAWLGSGKKWPTYEKGLWHWHASHDPDEQTRSDTLPMKLLLSLGDRTSFTCADSLRSVVAVIVSGRWTP